MKEILLLLKELVLPAEEKINRFRFIGRLMLYLFFLLWGMRLMALPMNDLSHSFMHLVNLPFHEAGHIIFAVFGDFMRVLGGTLMQHLIPFIVMCTLLFKNHDAFGASLGLWWLGQSLMDAAPYIDDARAGQLMLLGGVTGKEAPGYHDWENILDRLGWLKYDHFLARLSYSFGVLLMIISFVWAGYVLYRQYGRLRSEGKPDGAA